jgi:outer membrane protein TolC
LSLPQALEIARRNNPSLAAVRFAVAKAQAVQRVARAKRLPHLTARGTAGLYDRDQRLQPASTNGELGSFSKTIFGGELNLSYPLYTGGTLKAEEKAARFDAQAGELQHQRAQREIVYSVSKVFIHILAQQKLIAALEFNCKSLTSHLAQVQNMVAAQKAAKIDQLRMDVRIADLEEKLARGNNELDISRQTLASLMGLDKADFHLSGVLTEPRGEATAADAIPTLLQEASHARHDLSAMRENLRAQASRVDAAIGGRRPQLLAVGAYGARLGVDANDDESAYSGSVGLALDVPIFDGGLRQAKVETETAALAVLRKQYEAMEQRIALEVKTAALNLNSARIRFRATHKSVEQATEVLRIQNETYRLGKSTVTDFLDAQTALLTSQTNYYSALAEYRIAKAELALASGKTEEQ